MHAQLCCSRMINDGFWGKRRVTQKTWWLDKPIILCFSVMSCLGGLDYNTLMHNKYTCAQGQYSFKSISPILRSHMKIFDFLGAHKSMWQEWNCISYIPWPLLGSRSSHCCCGQLRKQLPRTSNISIHLQLCVWPSGECAICPIFTQEISSADKCSTVFSS